MSCCSICKEEFSEENPSVTVKELKVSELWLKFARIKS